MKIIKILLVTVFALVATSCSYLPTNELIRPPQMTEEQNDIHNALLRAVGVENITFKYPRSSEYPSAIILKNLDNDGEKEAIVFYKLDSGQNTRINILDKKDNKWVSIYDVAGYGQEIDFLDFAKVTDQDNLNIIIGWSGGGSDKKTLTAYSYDDQQLLEIANYRYDDVVISDIDANGIDDILIVDFRNSDIIRLLQQVGNTNELEAVGEAPLTSNVSEIINITVGELSAGKRAIFVDEKIDNERYKTDIFIVEGSNLINVIMRLEEEEGISGGFSERSIDITSKDYDGDGIIDVPSTEPMPGHDEDDEDAVFLTYFWNIEQSSTRAVFYAAVNQKNSYMIKYPTRWVDAITVQQNNLTGEWAFVLYQSDETLQSTPYLRVRVYSRNDYKDKYESESFSLRAQKGMLEYYTYIPPTTGDFAITEEELNEMFVLLV